MDRDRIEGAAKKVTGRIKEAVGRAVGDSKIEADGKAERAEGAVQNTIGGVKDSVREIVRGKE